MKSALQKIFGGLQMSWSRVVIFAVVMGFYTALMAMLAPAGNSLHDIAVTMEWWVLPAVLVIVNTEKPLEAASKVFVFFLISQPLVYLFQVPFNAMGWGLFGYYGYWFMITLLTFPCGYVGWYMKKDRWYSAVIAAVLTTFLALSGVRYIASWGEEFPNHLLTTIYCFAMIPVMVLGIFREKKTQMIGAILSAGGLLASVVVVFGLGAGQIYETYNSYFLEEGSVVLVGQPEIELIEGDVQSAVELIDSGDGYTLKMRGIKGRHYKFKLSDEKTSYVFEYYSNAETQTVEVERVE